jgi:hypothetical protein
MLIDCSCRFAPQALMTNSRRSAGKIDLGRGIKSPPGQRACVLACIARCDGETSILFRISFEIISGGKIKFLIRVWGG